MVYFTLSLTLKPPLLYIVLMSESEYSFIYLFKNYKPFYNYFNFYTCVSFVIVSLVVLSKYLLLYFFGFNFLELVFLQTKKIPLLEKPNKINLIIYVKLKLLIGFSIILVNNYIINYSVIIITITIHIILISSLTIITLLVNLFYNCFVSILFYNKGNWDYGYYNRSKFFSFYFKISHRRFLKISLVLDNIMLLLLVFYIL